MLYYINPMENYSAKKGTMGVGSKNIMLNEESQAVTHKTHKPTL